VVRGAEGVLLTTSARGARQRGVAQPDGCGRSGARAASRQELGKVLGDVATKQQALLSADAAKAQQECCRASIPRTRASTTARSTASKPARRKPARAPGCEQAGGKFAEPLVLLDAPASINWATPASTVLFAGEQLHWTSQGDAHMTAAHTLSSVAANAAGYFSQNGGIQAIAANGPVSLQSTPTSWRSWPTKKSRSSRSTTASRSRPTRKSL
jgi:type VI secretion system secreted protein VgrG